LFAYLSPLISLGFLFLFIYLFLFYHCELVNTKLHLNQGWKQQTHNYLKAQYSHKKKKKKKKLTKGKKTGD
jgi:hypothetical protein